MEELIENKILRDRLKQKITLIRSFNKSLSKIVKFNYNLTLHRFFYSRKTSYLRTNKKKT